ncbi:MAG: HAD family phosphatase [Saprospiraceae bacterium]|nr:HAD family phosphatase [Saprospiraceae bacterium]MBK6567041.1 HAD family phosphatase [Saprospiraceae bacterium]MBK6783893.1 HAD family phosphatase [Saprospiraceae bacterium]MBK7525142.1 HAD family phosphatase [Saprospiraceae bacterium]MBK8079858.1 HAD family phosphatase [Saprospiraceae bacterium]
MIRNIIFDFGGVLLDIDMKRTYDILAKQLKQSMTFPDIPDELREVVVAFETGNMSVENFIWNIQNMCPDPKPQGYDVITAWNAMLIGWNTEKFNFLKQLRHHYQTYILSNTNQLHIEWVRRDLLKNHGIEDFENTYFDKVYYSFEIGKHKPSNDIYQYVLDDAGLSAEETLFIDDSLINVQSAAGLGIHVYHHDPGKDLMETFDKNGWLLYGK